MGDRRPWFPFGFWSSATASAAAAATVPAATASAPTQNAGQTTSAIAKRPSRFPSMEIAVGTGTNPPTPIFPPPAQHTAPDQLESTASSPKTPTWGNTQITISGPSNDPQPTSSLPGSPSHWTPQSRSPPEQASEGVPPISPSKEPRTTIQESQQKPETEYGGVDAIKGQAINGTSFKHDMAEAMSTISSQAPTTDKLARDPDQTAATSKEMETSNAKGENKPPTETEEKSDEVKEGKQVVSEMIAEAKEEMETAAHELLVPKSGSEAHTNEKSNTPKSDGEKRTTISDAHNKFGLPAGGDDFRLQNDIRNYISTFINWMAVSDLKDSVYNKSFSVMVTLSGENKGASMQIGSDSQEAEDPVHDQSVDAAPDKDGTFAEERIEDANTTEDQPDTFVNNNAQGINNSIVFDGSISERNPGVRMAIVANVPNDSIQSTDTSLIEA